MGRLEEYIKESKAVKAFAADAESGRLSHAYLISAEDLDTVNAAMNILTKAALCPTHGCGNCETCLRIDHGNHANVHDYSEYSVDTVRSVIAATYLQNVENGAAVFRLYDFNGVSQAAQNKLLKTLEEPSDNVLILIATTLDAAILKTISSRVKKIRLNIWNAERIAQALESEGADEEAAKSAAALYPDSLTKARAALGDKDITRAYKQIFEMLSQLNNSSEIPRFLNVFGETNEELNVRLDILASVFALALRDSADNADTPITRKFNIAAITNIIEAIADAKAKAKVFVNTTNIAANLLMDILEIRYKTA